MFTKKQITSYVLALLSAAALCGVPVIAQSQSPTAASSAPKETSPAQHTPAQPGPIVHNWTLRKLHGNVNLMVNPDGTYNLSGTMTDSKPGLDWDLTVALKNNMGSVVVFQYAGDASNGVQFNKEGSDPILKENYSSFAQGHSAAFGYTFHLNREGKATQYEAREQKLKKLRKEEEEARKRHDKKVATEKRAAIERERQQQIAEQQAAAKQHSSGGGGGSSFGSVMSTIGSIASKVIGFL